MKTIDIKLKDDTIYRTTKDYFWLPVEELNDDRKKFIEIGDYYFSKNEIKLIRVVDLSTNEEVEMKVNDEGEKENGIN